MHRIVVAIGAMTLLVGCADDDRDAVGSASRLTSSELHSSTIGDSPPRPDTATTTPDPSADSTTGSSARPPDPTPTSTSGVAQTGDAPTATADAEANDATNHDVGVSFELPPGWERSSTAVATEFSAGADCTAATIVDFEPPTDPAAEGEAAFALRSTVQICARSVDGRSLDEFLDDTYGDEVAFEPAELGGLAGFRTTSGRDTIFFIQSASNRFQVLTSVAADLTLEGERLAEVADIIDTMTFE